MDDGKLPPLLQAGIPGILAGLLQLGMALAIGKLPPLAQLIGAILVAGLVGGGVSEALLVGLHWSSTLAGIAGAASGAIPAIFWTSVAQSVAKKQIQDRFGIDTSSQPSEPAPPPAETDGKGGDGK